MTKWLAAFVPVTALVTAAVLTGPQLVRSVQAAPSGAAWAADRWGVILGVIALLGAVTAILWSGARVLSTEPSDIAMLADSPDGSKALSAAIGTGVTAPEFFTKEDFDEAMSDLANAWDQDDGVAADDPRLVRLRRAVEALREWSLFREIQAPFAQFRYVFVAASAVMVAAMIYIPFTLGPSLQIGEVSEVTVRVSTTGALELREATGCTDPERSTFLAIGGTGEQPRLAVDGPDCRFGATWQPGTVDAELRLP